MANRLRLWLTVLCLAIMTIWFGMHPAEAKTPEITGAGAGLAAQSLPADDRIDTAFSFQMPVAAKYRAILVRICKDGQEAYYYYPANKEGKAGGKVYLRFGKGMYQVDFNLVKAKTADPAKMEFDRLAGVKLENTNSTDGRYLFPSWGVESDSKEVRQLAVSITKGSSNDYAKIKAIHDWVSKNITYDLKKYQQNQLYDNQGALYTLKARRGLCLDYSNLTTALLRSLSIESRTVLGNAGEKGSWGGHAWNEAKINGQWISLDTTWDSGVNIQGKYVAKFSTSFFNPKPEVFQKSHLKTREAL